MREGGTKLARIRDELAAFAQSGVTLIALDKLARELTKKAGGTPAFLGYRPDGATRPYPAAICTSVNNVVVHGPPNSYALKAGDVLKIDLGLLYKGFYTDTAITVGIGVISPLAQTLIDATREALTKAIEQCYVGNTVGDVGVAISHYIKKCGLFVVKELTGHGIGRALHEEPIVYNDGRSNTGAKLVSGMTLAIEPIVSAGGPLIRQLKDESYATVDNSLAAHFEHTVAITDSEPEILTK